MHGSASLRALFLSAFLGPLGGPLTVMALAAPQETPAAPPAAAPAPPIPTGPPPTKEETDRLSLLLRLPKPNAAGYIGDPYPLDTCIVTGAKLGADAVTVVLKDQRNALQEGRQLRFANEAARLTFNTRPGEFLDALDREIIRLHEASYPLDRDVVEIDRKLTERFPFVYGNRCYVVMRAKNIDNFLKQAGRYVGVFDKLMTTKQRSHYPLTTSLVSGEALPEKPFDVVIGYRLVRLCNEAEAKTLLEKPGDFLPKLPALKSP